jgi:hypothetical protein
LKREKKLGGSGVHTTLAELIKKYGNIEEVVVMYPENDRCTFILAAKDVKGQGFSGRDE